MCGCGGGASGSFKYGTSSTSFCGSKISLLQDARNKLAILYNLTKDPVLKAKYKEDRNVVEQMLNDTADGQTCPDSETVMFIVTEVNNEYAKYYNS